MKKQNAGDAEQNLESYFLPDKFVLRLYVTGASPNSVRAIQNIRNLCETHLAQNYELEVIDVYQQPLVAQQEQIVALPMLVKSSPLPFKRLIGDMSDTKKVLNGLGLNI